MSRLYPRNVFILFVLLLLLVMGCNDVPPAEPVLRPVRYQKVFVSGGERTRSFSGVARAGQESRLSFKVAGTLRRLAVKVGDTVPRGQLIAEIDPTDYQLQVQQAQASLESARAQARNADASYERVRQLYENRNASRNDLDAARAAFESANAQVRALEKQLELAQVKLDYTRLTAPLAGAIATVDVEVNENVTAGRTIVQLSSGSQLEVEVAIPELLIARVREGQAVTAAFGALPGRAFNGRVTEVSVVSSGFATTYPVTIRLENDGEELRPGMAAEVSFTFSDEGQQERMVVPSVSVGEDRNGRFVFTVEPGDVAGEGVVRRNAVVIGAFTSEGIEVLEGLIDGVNVVTAGVSKLSDGQRVKFDAQN